ncbi:odorant receptor 49b-like [Malaya genurostris]|uniref:odorant receptor 49b-like n=1 Tax=Malaya genurostris TaxID=325434 RepID=UPI0026F37F4D|nr:odorant receptor 49b-like [Malaya genurostris]
MQPVQNFYPPKPQVLGLGLQLLRYIGLWGDPNRSVRYRLVLIVCYVLAVWIGPKTVLGPGKEGFDSCVRNVTEVLFLVENCVALVSFAAKSRSFGQLIDVLERILKRDWPKDLQDEIESFNRRMEKSSRFYAFYMLFILIVFAVGPLLYTMGTLIFSNETTDERGNFLLTNEMQFYWLDIRRNIRHYIIFTAFCCPVSCSSALIITLKGTIFQAIIYYGSKLFDLLSKRIHAMAAIADEEKRRRELREIVQLHQMTLAYLHYLESTLNIILLNQMLSCLFVWCLMLFYVSSNFGPEAVNVIVMFVVLVIEMAAYCVNGTILSGKAAGIAEAMYRYAWYRDPIDMQRTAASIILRAQKPTGVTDAKFYFVNVQRLGKTVQATYSYYLILKDRF